MRCYALASGVHCRRRAVALDLVRAHVSSVYGIPGIDEKGPGGRGAERRLNTWYIPQELNSASSKTTEELCVQNMLAIQCRVYAIPACLNLVIRATTAGRFPLKSGADGHWCQYMPCVEVHIIN